MIVGSDYRKYQHYGGEIPVAKKLQTIVVIGVRSAMRRGDGVFFSRLPQSREQIFCLLSWHRTSMSAYRYSCLSKQQCKRCILAYLVPRYSFWAWQVACKSLFHPSYFGFLLVLPVGISGHCSFHPHFPSSSSNYNEFSPTSTPQLYSKALLSPL